MKFHKKTNKNSATFGSICKASYKEGFNFQQQGHPNSAYTVASDYASRYVS